MQEIFRFGHNATTDFKFNFACSGFGQQKQQQQQQQMVQVIKPASNFKLISQPLNHFSQLDNKENYNPVTKQYVASRQVSKKRMLCAPLQDITNVMNPVTGQTAREQKMFSFNFDESELRRKKKASHHHHDQGVAQFMPVPASHLQHMAVFSQPQSTSQSQYKQVPVIASKKVTAKVKSRLSKMR